MSATLTLNELAVALGLHLHTIRRAVRRGEIPYHRVGRRIFFVLDEVLDATRESQPPAVQNIHKRSTYV